MGNAVSENLGPCIPGPGVGCEDARELDSDANRGDEKVRSIYCYLEVSVKVLSGVIETGSTHANLEGLDYSGELSLVVVVTCVIPGNTGTNDEEIAVSTVGGYMSGKIYGVGLILNAGFDLEVVLTEE